MVPDASEAKSDGAKKVSGGRTSWRCDAVSRVGEMRLQLDPTRETRQSAFASTPVGSRYIICNRPPRWDGPWIDRHKYKQQMRKAQRKCERQETILLGESWAGHFWLETSIEGRTPKLCDAVSYCRYIYCLCFLLLTATYSVRSATRIAVVHPVLSLPFNNGLALLLARRLVAELAVASSRGFGARVDA